MGFGGQVESGAWCSEFTCPICSTLVDLEESTITPCSHVFCATCLRQWLTSKSQCPSCRAAISNACSLPSLKEANPLAWRVLGRVRIFCPAKCGWVGEYSNLQTHLTASDAHEGALDKDELATVLKNEGNEKFQAANYVDALRLYTKAISTCPTMPELYSNRCAAYAKLGNHTDALQDALKATELNPDFSKAWGRAINELWELGRFEEAVILAEESKGRAPKTMVESAIKYLDCLSLVKDHINKGEYSEARLHLGVLMEASEASNILILAARVEAHAGKGERALTLSLRALRSDTHNPLAYVARGEALFFADDKPQDCLDLIKEALRLDPDHTEALSVFKHMKHIKTIRERADSSVGKSSDYEAALDLLTDVINDDFVPSRCRLRAQLLGDRANVLFRLGKYQQALVDCAASISIQDDNRRAWLTRIYVLQQLERYHEAVNELESIVNGGWGNNDAVLQGAYDNAKFLYRKSKRPNYYDLFQVSSIASQPEIKAAYKLRAMECHPDKLSSALEESDRKNALEKFKLLGEGLEILSDPFRRDLYDKGFDKEAIEERVQRAQRQSNGSHHHHH